MDAVARTDSAADAIREHLERILSSPAFSAAGRRIRLLRFLVDRSLAGDSGSLKESVIAVEVFDRAPGFDPKLDSAVRVEIGRLRSRLNEYYSQTGQRDPIRIEIPKGSYQPIFILEERPVPKASASPSVSPGRPWKTIGGAAAIVALCLAALTIWSLGAARGDATAPTIAVLPFLNLSGDSANEYISDSLADELTGVLAEAKDMRVVARTSAFQFKGRSMDIRQIGNLLGARAILEGSLSKQIGQYRIVVQLIRTADGYHLWSHTYEARPEDLQRVEIEIARATESALLPGGRGPDHAEPITTANPEAHDLYLRAKYYLAVRTPEALRQSLMLARQAIEKDPSYPLPYETIGTAEWALGTLLVEPQKVAAERALEALDKAIALNPRYGDAHALRAGIIYNRDWDWPRAEKEFRLALQLGSPKAHSLFGWGLATRGRFGQAQEHLRIAEELDPLAAGPLQNRAGAFYMAGNYPEARRELRRWLELDPRAFYALLLLGAVDLADRNCPAAQQDLQKMAELYPQLPASKAALVGAAARCGQPEAARRYLAEVAQYQAQAAKNGTPGIWEYGGIAAIYASLHDGDHVIEYLGKAVDNREGQVLWLKFDPCFAEFRRDPGYIELERRVGLFQ